MRIDIPLNVEHASSGAASQNRKEHPHPRVFTQLLTTQVRHPPPPPWLVQAAAATDDVAEVLDKAALMAGRQFRRHRPLRVCAARAPKTCTPLHAPTIALLASERPLPLTELAPLRLSALAQLAALGYLILLHLWLLVLLVHMIPNVETVHRHQRQHVDDGV